MIKPDTNTVKNFEQKTGAEILNAIKNDAMTSEAYKENVPDAAPMAAGRAASLQSLHDIWGVLNTYPSLQTEFANSLIARIAMTLIKGKSFLNPYAMFKRGILEVGDIIQDVYVDLVVPHKYNPGQAEKTWMKRELPRILTQYYRVNSKAFYKMSISTADLTRAFTSWQGIEDLIARLVGRLMDSLQYDEFMLTKYIIARYILDGRFAVYTTSGNMEENAGSIKAISNGMVFPSTEYNPAGVVTTTEKSEQYLFMSAAYAAKFDVEVLANAFNMEKVDFLGHQVMYDSLSKYDWSRMSELLEYDVAKFTADEMSYLDSVQGVLIDVDALLIFDDLLESRQAENGEGLYWQHWLHSWKTLAMSPFANQVVFVSQKGTVTTLTITPETTTGIKGKSVFFVANAEYSGGIGYSAVEWSVDSDVSTIGTYGQLQISPDETKTMLTVTATSKMTPSVSATATVTIK